VAHEDIIGKYVHLVARPENFTPPTKNPDDCICGAKGDENAGRILIPNCPCCAGVQVLVEELHDEPQRIKFLAVFSPNTTMRIRRIENAEEII